jgi:hypothetical protein
MPSPSPRKPTSRLDVALIFIVMVVALTVGAAIFRVWTAPERIRMRLDSAKASCLNAGGEWVKVGREESCRPAVDRTQR